MYDMEQSEQNNYVAVVDDTQDQQGVVSQGSEEPLMSMEDTTKEDLRILQEEFNQQLKTFAEDDSYMAEYTRFSPRTKNVLVKVFNFKPSIKGYVGKAVFMIKSQKDSEWRPRTIAASEKLYPIVKVVRKGALVSEDIQVGKLYIVPNEDIEGTSLNPEFMHLMQNFAKQGKNGAITNVPEDLPQRLNNIDIHWVRYRFRMPDRVGDYTEDDFLFYLIPESKIEATYEPLV